MFPVFVAFFVLETGGSVGRIHRRLSWTAPNVAGKMPWWYALWLGLGFKVYSALLCASILFLFNTRLRLPLDATPWSGGNSLVPLLVNFLLPDSHHFSFLFSFCSRFCSLSLFLQALASALSLHSLCTFSAGDTADQDFTVCSALHGSSLHACCSLIPSRMVLAPPSDGVCWGQTLYGGLPRARSYQLHHSAADVRARKVCTCCLEQGGEA